MQKGQVLFPAMGKIRGEDHGVITEEKGMDIAAADSSSAAAKDSVASSIKVTSFGKSVMDALTAWTKIGDMDSRSKILCSLDTELKQVEVDEI